MKTFTHTTKYVRSPKPIRVMTLTSESGKMRLTTAIGELWDYEYRHLGKAGAISDLEVIPDEAFGAMLQTMLEEGTLEEDYI